MGGVERRALDASVEAAATDAAAGGRSAVAPAVAAVERRVAAPLAVEAGSVPFDAALLLRVLLLLLLLLLRRSRPGHQRGPQGFERKLQAGPQVSRSKALRREPGEARHQRQRRGAQRRRRRVAPRVAASEPQRRSGHLPHPREHELSRVGQQLSQGRQGTQHDFGGDRRRRRRGRSPRGGGGGGLEPAARLLEQPIVPLHPVPRLARLDQHQARPERSGGRIAHRRARIAEPGPDGVDERADVDIEHRGRRLGQRAQRERGGEAPVAEVVRVVLVVVLVPDLLLLLPLLLLSGGTAAADPGEAADAPQGSALRDARCQVPAAAAAAAPAAAAAAAASVRRRPRPEPPEAPSHLRLDRLRGQGASAARQVPQRLRRGLQRRPVPGRAPRGGQHVLQAARQRRHPRPGLAQGAHVDQLVDREDAPEPLRRVGRRDKRADAAEGLGEQAREPAAGAARGAAEAAGVGEEGAAGADAGAEVVARRRGLRGRGLYVVAQGPLTVSPALEGAFGEGSGRRGSAKTMVVVVSDDGEEVRSRGKTRQTNQGGRKKKHQSLPSLTWPAQFAEGPGEALVGVEATSTLRGRQRGAPRGGRPPAPIAASDVIKPFLDDDDGRQQSAFPGLFSVPALLPALRQAKKRPHSRMVRAERERTQPPKRKPTVEKREKLRN